MSYTSLAEVIIPGPSKSHMQKVWTCAPAGVEPAVAVVFLDGELYVQKVKAPAVVRRLDEQKITPPTLAVFVSSNGAAARHRDFVCDPAYPDFIAVDLVDWTRREYPTVGEFVIAGLSLSGLAAAYIATRYPATFRSAICQSPSFWWERGRFGEDLPVVVAPGQEYWISVGSRETETDVSHPPSAMVQELTQLAGCALACEALRSKGYSITYLEFDGGHDPACWREDLALALSWVWRRGCSTIAEPAGEVIC